jgi:hypothetical protein
MISVLKGEAGLVTWHTDNPPLEIGVISDAL